jgi:hypothetical protein
MKLGDRPVMIDLDADRDAIADLMRAASWPESVNGCDYCDHRCGPEPRQMIHRRGKFGCDIDLAGALDDLAKADQAAWVADMFDHELRMRVPGDPSVWSYHVTMPTSWLETHTQPTADLTA